MTEQKTAVPAMVSAYLSIIGRRGGSVCTKSKGVRSAENGRAPVKPGSRPRGRPKKVKE
jgi:hypothetical protein